MCRFVEMSRRGGAHILGMGMGRHMLTTADTHNLDACSLLGGDAWRAKHQSYSAQPPTTARIVIMETVLSWIRDEV